MGLGLLVLLAVFFAFALAGLIREKLNTADRRDVSAQERADNATAARFPTDFRSVCDDGSVSNAAEYAEPYRILAFEQGYGRDFFGTFALGQGLTSNADWSAVESVNVVACLYRKADTEVQTGTCELESGGKNRTLDHYAVDYELVVFEARTGSKIRSLGTVRGPATECPVAEFFDEQSRKIYGSADQSAVEAKLEEFAGG